MEIPQEVKKVIKKLKESGYEGYIVGGCVRDSLTQTKEPNDWDITTNAKPKEIQKIFSNSFYKNKFLTVTVQTESENPKLKEIEITTYRSESGYKDKRHPEKVKFVKTLKEDLARRDFTVNAMAIDIIEDKTKVIDYFNGEKDLKNQIIRTVGDPNQRFNEDALRIMRAVRFATYLKGNWKIEDETKKAIKKHSQSLKLISKERIRDEFIKIIMTPKAKEGIESLRKLNLLKQIIPELLEGYQVKQNKHHIYDVYEHCIRSLEYAAKKNFGKHVRIAALLHDIGKPEVKEGKGEEATFYNHEIVGANMTYKILKRLKFSKKDIKKITKLVRYHLFYYTPDEVGESSVRRLVRNVGAENMDELIELRMADRIGSGVPKAEPYKLRHLRYVIEKVSQDPLSTSMLKVSGNDIIKILNIKPGPKIGFILNILLGYVLDDPQKNNKEFLSKKIKVLGQLEKNKLMSLSKKAIKKRKEIEMKRDQMTKKKYWVT
jgi:poly(A) polymerase/tRNA nucleotidyltransferase (CCA-adding enzyme)